MGSSLKKNETRAGETIAPTAATLLEGGGWSGGGEKEEMRHCTTLNVSQCPLRCATHRSRDHAASSTQASAGPDCPSFTSLQNLIPLSFLSNPHLLLRALPPPRRIVPRSRWLSLLPTA
jgi:hypothetical protein